MEEEEEMKNTIIKTALTILLPYLVDLIRDLIKPEGVVIFRDKVLELLRELTQKTETELDDKALEFAIETAFTLGNIKTYGLKLISMAKGYVVMSETKYDDTYCLPILQKLEEVLGVVDVEEDEPVS